MQLVLSPLKNFGVTKQDDVKEFIHTTQDNDLILKVITLFGVSLVDDATVYEFVGEPLSKNPNASKEVLSAYVQLMKDSQFGLIPSLIRRFLSDKRVDNKQLNKLVKDKGLDKSLVAEEEIAEEKFKETKEEESIED